MIKADAALKSDTFGFVLFNQVWTESILNR